MLHITDPFAAAFFKEMSGSWFCTKTGKNVLGAILTFYRQIQGAPRLPLTEEIKEIPGVIYQVFEGGIICYDPQKNLDAPNGFTPCYLVKLAHPLAQHLLTQPLQDQLSNAQAQIVGLQEQLQAAQTLDHATLVSIMHTLQPFVALSKQIQKVVNQS